jgi:hypothetical protein
MDPSPGDGSRARTSQTPRLNLAMGCPARRQSVPADLELPQRGRSPVAEARRVLVRDVVSGRLQADRRAILRVDAGATVGTPPAPRRVLRSPCPRDGGHSLVPDDQGMGTRYGVTSKVMIGIAPW